jgi:hypothetical protein
MVKFKKRAPNDFKFNNIILSFIFKIFTNHIMSNFHDKNVALDKIKKLSANTCVINSKGDFDEIWSSVPYFKLP